jgi:transcriptional regulator with XRE-family HTH domain
MIRSSKHAWLKRVGEQVAARRKELGFVSQRELAKAAGVATNTPAQLERGQSWPHEANRRKLESALQWPDGTLDALRRGDQEPTPTPAVPQRVEEPPVTAPSMLSVTRNFVGAVRVCMEILGEQTDQRAMSAMARLERSVLEMEMMLAAALPDAGAAFHDTVAALEQLHEIRSTVALV